MRSARTLRGWDGRCHILSVELTGHEGHGNWLAFLK